MSIKRKQLVSVLVKFGVISDYHRTKGALHPNVLKCLFNKQVAGCFANPTV